jgi:hypothetical protein
MPPCELNMFILLKRFQNLHNFLIKPHKIKLQPKLLFKKEICKKDPLCEEILLKLLELNPERFFNVHSAELSLFFLKPFICPIVAYNEAINRVNEFLIEGKLFPTSLYFSEPTEIFISDFFINADKSYCDEEIVLTRFIKCSTEFINMYKIYNNKFTDDSEKTIQTFAMNRLLQNLFYVTTAFNEVQKLFK